LRAHPFCVLQAAPELSRILPPLLSALPSFASRNAEKIESELASTLSTTEEKHHVLARLTNGESLVFYYKLIGDYHRYGSEVLVEQEGERAVATLRSRPTDRPTDLPQHLRSAALTSSYACFCGAGRWAHTLWPPKSQSCIWRPLTRCGLGLL
jgi:hypothetical protein